MGDDGPDQDGRVGPPGALAEGLVRMSFTVVALLTQIAAEEDLSLTQLRVLAILRDRRPKMAELADHLGLERSSVSGLIDRAVARGLVRREPGRDDARVILVGLTDTGRELAERLAADFDGLLAPLTGRLRPAEQRRLGELLARLSG